MLVRRISEEELDREDARILHKTARLPENIRTGTRAKELKRQYWDRLFRPTSVELFQLLIGEITPDQVSPAVYDVHKDLIQSLHLKPGESQES